MRHLKSGRKLGRTRSHRKATLSSLSTAVIAHKRITTTLAKAKETRTVVEKLVTRAKRAVASEGEGQTKNVHARREVFSFLRDRKAVTTLFNDIAPKVASRPGGYTRVVKLGQRRGDGAQLALLEFVDFNVGQSKTTKTQPKAAKSAQRKKASKKPAVKAEAAAATEEAASPQAEEHTESETKKD
ncbi:MAG: 50S ribosomal protein L17 [Ignavibacteria bacterium]|nr:50S ribosomal protein L17 [Ignavibacteria bacterium]